LQEEFELEGDYYGESLTRLSFKSGTSLPCTTRTSTGTTFATCTESPQMPDGPGEAHVILDLPDTLEVMVVSSDDEPMEGLEGHLEEEDDLEERQEIDEVVEK